RPRWPRRGACSGSGRSPTPGAGGGRARRRARAPRRSATPARAGAARSSRSRRPPATRPNRPARRAAWVVLLPDSLGPWTTVSSGPGSRALPASFPNPLTVRRSTRMDHLGAAVEGAQAGQDGLVGVGVAGVQKPGHEPAAHGSLARERVEVVGGHGAVDDRELGQAGRAALGDAARVDLAARLDL